MEACNNLLVECDLVGSPILETTTVLVKIFVGSSPAKLNQIINRLDSKVVVSARVRNLKHETEI